MKKTLLILLVLLTLVFCYGCAPGIDMPFNGDIEFHSITLTVPERFIRDSTQSNEDLWVFEHGNYSEYVLISRKDITGDTTASLESYVEYMKENHADSEIVTFMEGDAVHSVYYMDEVFCQEMLFPYEGSFYAIALRGGTESSFEELTATIKLSASTEISAA